MAKFQKVNIAVTLLNVGMLNVVMLMNVGMFNVFMPNVIMLSVIMLNVVMLIVIMLSSVAPFESTSNGYEPNILNLLQGVAKSDPYTSWCFYAKLKAANKLFI